MLVGRERAVALVNERAVRGAAHEIHSERHGEQTFTLGTHLPLEEAGQRTGIRPNSIRYHDAIEELEYEGAIEWARVRDTLRETSTTSSLSPAWKMLGRDRGAMVQGFHRKQLRGDREKEATRDGSRWS